MKTNDLCLTPTRGVSNLEFALLWMPRSRRRDALLFYRFCRTIDDIADEDGRTPEEKEELLGKWLKAVETGLPDNLENLLERHGIDRRLLAEIVEGCASDIRPRLFETVADLEEYCRKVACAVGLVSIRIFGCVDPLSAAYATHLGHGLQLTNILRDIGEDAAQGRIYLPFEDLRRHAVDPAAMLGGVPCMGLPAVLAKVAGRARARFAAAKAPNADFNALLPARIMRAIYEKTLSRIEIEGFPILPRRRSLSLLQKLICAASACLARPRSATWN